MDAELVTATMAGITLGYTIGYNLNPSEQIIKCEILKEHHESDGGRVNSYKVEFKLLGLIRRSCNCSHIIERTRCDLTNEKCRYL